MDTSQCVSVSAAGVANYTKRSSILLIPNPSTGQFEISISEPENFSGIRVYNILGQILYSQETVHKTNSIDLRNLAEGFYFVEVIGRENANEVERLIIRN